ncbi:crotonobetainyl-CoA--carnitine CoA-transferase [Micromonospora craterilacus]|uniref:Crotonobetainyl-CoA--carnitine CoA-transferase n=1 Tax=Micromonospora craterilacus TaxID=1655439 RepID=A0A2W2EJG1_9ACTN|nr:crotonobetainyl-CoA--carnitine CoA-transferase [Micromonospora craterilacus]PZG24426.1 crotonobetainyl-CoA--carnitine CoA-transferase [Micromonospora craterilacus]
MTAEAGSAPARVHLSARHDRLLGLAQAYVDEAAARGELPHRDLSRLPGTRVRVDPEFCREVAGHFDRAPRRALDADLAARYARFTEETLRHFALLEPAGLTVVPWPGPGQPYRGAADLIDALDRTGVLYVYLTNDGHGPHGPTPDHPLCAPSGVTVDGVELLHNDIFRVVHDIFGHVLLGATMGVAGEFRAAYGHMAMYSPQVHPVVFTEQVSQICWFFHGPHLADRSGRWPRRGEPGWIPPTDRPYPEQKLFPCPPGFLGRFTASFTEETR